MLKKAIISQMVLVSLALMSCSQSANSNTGTTSNDDSNVGAAALANGLPTPPPTPATSDEPISISSPSDGAQVVYREIIRGVVKDVKAKVWVVVRPMSGSDYWVQPPVDVEKTGEWSVQGYLGQSERANIGERFKLMAIANPKAQLKEGDRLRGWPEAQSQSHIIEVVRK